MKVFSRRERSNSENVQAIILLCLRISMKWISSDRGNMSKESISPLRKLRYVIFHASHVRWVARTHDSQIIQRGPRVLRSQHYEWLARYLSNSGPECTQDCATPEHICRYELISIYALQPSRLKGRGIQSKSKWKKCDLLSGPEELPLC